jgi:hypothetical protein
VIAAWLGALHAGAVARRARTLPALSSDGGGLVRAAVAAMTPAGSAGTSTSGLTAAAAMALGPAGTPHAELGMTAEALRLAVAAGRSAVHIVHLALVDRTVAIKALIADGLVAMLVRAVALRDAELGAAAINVIAYCMSFFQDDIVARIRAEMIRRDAVRLIADMVIEDPDASDRSADIISCLLNGTQLSVPVNEPGVAEPKTLCTRPTLGPLSSFAVLRDVEELYNPTEETD